MAANDSKHVNDARLGDRSRMLLRSGVLKRNVTAVLVLLNAVIAALGGFSVYHDRQGEVRDAEAITSRLATVVERNVAGLIARMDLALLAARDEFERRESGLRQADGFNAFLGRQAARIPEAFAFRMADADGRVVHGDSTGMPVAIADQSHFIRARDAAESGLIVGHPVFTKIGGQWVLPVARRVSHRDGSFAGVVYALISLDTLAEMFSQLDLGHYGGIALRDAELGMIVRVPKLEGVGAKIGDRSVSATAKHLVATGRTPATYTTTTPADRRERTVTLRAVGELPLYVVATLATDEYLAGWRERTYWMVALILAVMGISSWLGWLLAKSWQRRLNAVRKLADSQQLFQTLTEHANEWVFWRSDDKRTFHYLSPLCETMTGYRAAEFQADPDLLDRIIHADDRQRWNDHLRHCEGADAHPPEDYRIVTKQREIRWMRHSCRAIVSPDGVPMGRRATNQDVSTEKRIEAEKEAALRQVVEGERRLRAMIDATDEAALLIKPDGTILTINTVGAERVGLTPDSMVGSSFFDFVGDLADKRRADIQRIAATGEPLHGSDWFESLLFENRFFPVKDEAGAVESIAIHAKNVTEQWRATEIEAIFHRLGFMMLRWSMSTESIAQQFCEEILPAFDLAAAWIGRVERDDTLTLIAAAEHRSAGFVEKLRERGQHIACVPAIEILRSKQMRKIAIASIECASCRTAGCAAGIEAALLLPLILHGKPWGVLAFCARTADRFDQPDLPPQLTAISARIATSLEASVQQEWLALLETALETTAGAVFITDAAGRILWVNRALVELTGYARDDMIGATPRIFASGAQDADFFARFWQTIQAGKIWRGEIVNARRDGSLYTVTQTVTPLRDEFGISHYVSILDDITARKEAVARIEHMATFDMLTDLPNRSLFFDRLGQSIALARRNKQVGALLFVDLDRFKEVNDRYGHEAGDRLLKAVAQRFREQVRETDTVARLGGDEFAMLLPHAELPDDVARIAEKIIAAVNRPFDLDGQTAHVGVSIGIALYPLHGDSPRAALNAADQAMYCAKQAGRNRYAWADDAAAVSEAPASG